MKFYSKIDLPILKKKISFNHLNNQHYFEILKFITNNDDIGLNEYFEWLLSEIIIEKEYLKSLTNVEKFLIILELRITSLGDQIQLNIENKAKVDISLLSIKNNILKNINEIELSKIIKDNDIEIKLNIPNSLLIQNIDNIYHNIIDYIKIQEQKINFYFLTEEEKDSIINNIPVNIITEMLNFVKINDIFNKINIITENKKIGLEGLKLSVFDKTLLLFLKSIYNDNLLNFYEIQYILMSKINLSFDQFMRMNMNECKIFINFYNRDMKKQQEEQQKSSSSSSVPKIPMPSMPKFG